ncbi:hypothetical protein CDAR_197542 [Caerostris darwini]|uniref:Uncharacterized protein n=1 Tax=Caerostris darwini TaxID=1538125 RepID=A0AAV4T3F7_9ARAC|nr:hypothetical protein CDAR_197542 [Caerostris darwini]
MRGKSSWTKYGYSSNDGTIYQEESVPISNTSPTVTAETTITPQTDENTTCTCTYENLNYNLVAYAGLTRLKYGSEVNRGEKVEFYCLLSGFSKLNGPTEITCENCKSWDPTEFPTCVNPVAGDTVLEFRGHWNKLPKNYIGVEKGQWLNVKCISNGIASYPIWLVKNSSLVSTGTYIDMYTGNYVNMLNITNAREEHHGDYQCFVSGCRSTSFRVQVINSEILCPKLNEDDLTIHYEKEQTLNSQAAFFCKDSSKKLVGPNLLTCLANGQWSGNPPQCEKPCSVPKVAHGKIGRYVRSYGKTTFQELPEDAKIENNEKLYLTCESKYEPFGTTMKEEEITCNLGEWSRIPRCEPAKCRGPPPLTDNVHLISVNRTHKGAVVYVCKRYFDEKKHGNVTCSLVLGKEMRRYVKTLNVIYKSCRFPDSRQKITCVDGEWEGHLPPCLEDSCNVFKIDRGAFTQQVQKSEWRFFGGTRKWIEYEKVTVGSTKSPGSSLYVSCNEGYTFQGKGANDVEVKCRRGTFYPNPVCLITGVPYENEEDSKQDVSSFVNQGSDKRNPPENKAVDRAISTVHEKNSNRQPDVDDAVPPSACTCTYTGLDDDVIAYYGTDILENGQEVKKNEKVKFQCHDFGYYRLNGKKEITCEDCRPWHSAEYPSCVAPTTGDVIIRFPKDLRYLPANTLVIQKGATITITCLVNGFPELPRWAVPNPRIVSVRDISLSGYPGRVLYISNISEQHNGQYECYRYINRKKVFNIQVKVPTRNCSKFDEREFHIHYEKLQAVNSSASFSCKDKNQKIVGPRTLTCMPDGRWSGNAPRCQTMFPHLNESEGMHISYTDNFNEGSIASFHCVFPRERTGISHNLPERRMG